MNPIAHATATRRTPLLGRARTGIPLLAICLLSSPVAAQPAVAGEWIYRVVPGDSLAAIARTYLASGVAWQRLQRYNHLGHPRRLVSGRELRIPLAWLRTEATVATVVVVAGRARVEHASGAAAADLAVGDELRAGDVLATDDGASVTLQMADATQVLVSGATRARMESLLLLGRSGVASTRLALDKGEAESRVNPARVDGTRYEIRTPVLTLGVRGTEFRVRVDADGATTVAEVTQGKVVATPVGAPLTGSRRAPGNGPAETSIDAGFGLVAGASRPLAPAPLLGAPALDDVLPLVERVPLGFTWPAIVGAAAYRAQVFVDQAVDRRLLDGVFPAAAARWADLPDGSYLLRVRARDAQGLEGLSTQRAFVVKARPEPPFTTSPRAQARLQGERVELAWTRAAAAQRYRLQLASDAGFADLRIDRADLDSDRLEVRLPVGWYYWRLASVAAAGDQGPFSDASSFDLRETPPPPPLESPAVRGDQTVFHWRARNADDAFEVQVAHDPEFARLLVERQVDQPDLVLDTPAAGSYFIRVRTVEPEGLVGPYGAAQRFDVPRSAWWWLLPGVVLLLPLL